jgi:hypothetical protein
MRGEERRGEERRGEERRGEEERPLSSDIELLFASLSFFLRF